MRFPWIRGFLAAVVLLVAAAAKAGPLPAGLEPVRDAAIGQLGALYALPPEVAARPAEIEYVGRKEAIPPSWQLIPRYAAGAAQPAANRLIVVEARTGRYPFGDPAQTLRHELSHILLFRSVGPVPRWLDEGLAMRAAGEWSGEISPAAMLAGGFRRLTLDRLEADFAGGESETRRSYELARGFASSLFPTPADLTGFLLEVRARHSFREAFLLRFGRTPEEAFDRWTGEMPLLLRIILTVGSDGLFLGAALLLVPLAWLAVRRRRKKVLERMEPDVPEPPPIRFPEERDDDDGPVN